MARQWMFDKGKGAWGYAPPPTPTAGDVDSETEAKLAGTAEEGREGRSAAEQIAKRDAQVRADAAASAANAQVESARLAAEAQKYAADSKAKGYKNGGPVIKGEFKHANPTYTKFGQSGDSSLLAKGRK